jgi:4-hydroxyphenylpyruvate dioxygenase
MGRQDLWDNPAGIEGFEFVEFAAPDPAELATVFSRLGFKAIARHRHKDVTLFRQGGINFIINAEPEAFGQRFARLHGPSVCGMAFRVADAGRAYRRALELGAWGYDSGSGPMELKIPAVKGVGDSLIYLVDRWRGKDGRCGGIGDISIYDVDFEPIADADGSTDEQPAGVGLLTIDHLTHNVYRGRMNEWAEFYERLFNFRAVRYFDIEGKLTGVRSKAMCSPCGTIHIPINEEGKETEGQIQEYLDRYHGEGIQHIALATADIYRTVDELRAKGLRLLDTPDTYYELLEKRIPGHGEPLEALRESRILVDGAPGDLLLQIFSENQFGPVFFEFIQRKGNKGFGEGNFKALFESIELDQIRRGVLPGDPAAA